MASTTPDNISYPVNTDAQKSIEDRIYDTAASVQTALNTKASLSGAIFTGDVDVSSSGTYINGSNGTATFASSSSGKVPLVAKGASGQTANLQEWADSGFSVLASVDSAGRFLMPNQPRFFANRSGDQTGYNPSNQSNVVIFNSVASNIGNHYNGSTGKFTAPVSGIYSFTVGVYQSVNVSQLWPVINGGRAESFVPTAVSPNWAGSFTRYLNANDNIGVLAWSDGNTNVTVYANWYHTYFSGYLVG